MGMIDVAKKSVGLVPQLEVRMLQRRSDWISFPFLKDLVMCDVEGMTADLHVHVMDLPSNVDEHGQELPLEG